MRNDLGPFISLILRHKPETIGLTMDPNGWVDVNELIEGINKTGKHIAREELNNIVETNNKRRYEYSEDGKRIRASQGHSVNVDSQPEEKTPPAVLYHGTAKQHLPNILKEGLLPQKRIHVHLSESIQTASQVGKRHGELVVLEIEAQDLYAKGHKFYKSANGVWLTNRIPVEYVTVKSVE